MGVITFNGIPSTEFNLVVEREPDYFYPEREYSSVHVPGRSGDLIKDLNSFANVKRSYKIALAIPNRTGRLNSMYSGLMGWLHGGSGYRRLEDSYDPEHYRMAIYRASDSIENLFGDAGRGTLEFDCKPQRYLISGEKVREINYSQDSGTTWSKPIAILNETKFTAKPLIKIFGNGTANIVFLKEENADSEALFSITLSNISSYIIFDTDTFECYTMNGESKVYSQSSWKIHSGEGIPSGYSYLRFQPGPSSTISKIEIIPRWWEL